MELPGITIGTFELEVIVLASVFDNSTHMKGSFAQNFHVLVCFEVCFVPCRALHSNLIDTF